MSDFSKMCAVCYRSKNVSEFKNQVVGEASACNSCDSRYAALSKQIEGREDKGLSSANEKTVVAERLAKGKSTANQARDSLSERPVTMKQKPGNGRSAHKADSIPAEADLFAPSNRRAPAGL